MGASGSPHRPEAIAVQGVTCAYGERPVFQELSLALGQAEVLSLLGPNGCGKTTLLRCIAGLMPSRAGRVLLDGQDVTGLSETERARLMGFVFQEHAILFPYSVLEVVRMGRAPHLGLFAAPAARDTAIAREAIATVGLEHLAEKRYTQISGGERQLALIARALAQDPRILLLDEPTSHLDFGNQMLVLETVRRLASERGITVLMATHAPDHALFVADRVALMQAGRLLAVGTPDEVMTEDNLRALYRTEIRIVTVEDGEGRPPMRAAVAVRSGGAQSAAAGTLPGSRSEEHQ